MFGLSFLSPLFLVGAAAAAVPLALHLFFRRAEPVVEFGAMRYLRAAPVERASRRRLKEWLLLTLRCAALCLLALAFARPYLEAPASAPAAPATVVLVDTSASMSAPGRFEQARATAASVVRDAGATDAVGVMTFGATADLMAPLATDRAAALQAVAGIEPGAGATRFRSAFARAAEVIGDRPGRIVVVSDLQESGWDAGDGAPLPSRIAVTVAAVAPPDSNVGVTMLRVDRTEATATVQNFSATATTRMVTFSIDGRRVAAVPTSIAAGGSADATLALQGQGAGALQVTVDDPAGYQADNSRYAVLDVAVAPSVLVVTSSTAPGDAFYVERAIQVAEGSGGFRLRRLSAQQFSADPGAVTGVEVVVLLGSRGLTQPGRQALGAFVRRGGGVLVAAGADVDPAIVTEALSDGAGTSWQPGAAVRPADAGTVLRLASTDPRHPVFRPFSGTGALANVRFSRTVALSASPAANVLARSTDGSPALVEEQVGDGRAIFLSSDLNNQWNDLPVQPVFVPFLHEIVRYLAAPAAARGDYLVGDLPGAEGQTPGVTRVAGDRAVAVNVDVRESNPVAMSADAFQAGITKLNARAAEQAILGGREREDEHRLWQYALLLMLAVLAAESLVGRRLA